MALNRKPKILFCASTLGHILHFHLPYLQAFRSLGYEVWVVASSSQEIPFADFVITLPFEKNLTSPRNLQAIWKARKLFKEHSFDVVSTHTTLASAVIRAAILTIPARQRPLVFCTSHGYLFSEKEGWKIEILEEYPSEMGGYSLIQFMIKGENVYSKLKYESGAHRVQRVPQTETQ